MLDRFSIKNFKSIGESGVTLDLKPLTVLVGPNGSGKSSILHALAVFCQSLGQSLRHDGELIKFSSIEDLIHKNEIDRLLNFELTIIKDANRVGYRHTWRYDTGETVQSIIKDSRTILSIEHIGNKREGWVSVAKFSDGSDTSRGKIAPSGFPGTLSGWIFEQGIWPIHRPEFNEAHSIFTDIYNTLLEKTFFISSNRGRIPFQAQTGDVSASYFWVGSEGERLVHLLSLLDSPHYEDTRQYILKWSEKFGLLKLSAGVRGPNVLRAEYRDNILNAPLNLALASQGSRQILPIIIQLFWSPPNSLVMIEEPEISLHPEGQIEIIRLFADAIKNNKQQIIISTHSHFLQLALGIAVQEGLIKSNNIALYEIQKDKEGTKAIKAKLSQTGFPLGWSSSFDKVEKMVAREWFQSLEK